MFIWYFSLQPLSQHIIQDTHIRLTTISFFFLSSFFRHLLLEHHLLGKLGTNISRTLRSLDVHIDGHLGLAQTEIVIVPCFLSDFLRDPIDRLSLNHWFDLCVELVQRISRRRGGLRFCLCLCLCLFGGLRTRLVAEPDLCDRTGAIHMVGHLPDISPVTELHSLD